MLQAGQSSAELSVMGRSATRPMLRVVHCSADLDTVINIVWPLPFTTENYFNTSSQNPNPRNSTMWFVVFIGICESFYAQQRHFSTEN